MMGRSGSVMLELYGWVAVQLVDAAIGGAKTRLRSSYADRFVGLAPFGSHARGTARADPDVDLLVPLTTIALAAFAWHAFRKPDARACFGRA